MSRRSALLSAAVILLAPSLAAPLRAQAVEYANGTMKYRILTNSKGSQTTPVDKQEFDVGIHQQYTVKIVRQAKDTLRETVTVDSISVKSSTLVPDVANLVGGTFSLLVSPTGKLYSSKSPEIANPMMSQLSESVVRFLPVLRGKLTTGATWSDTTAGKVTQQGLELDRTIVANYTVLGDTTVAGEKAFRVKRLTSTRSSGSSMASGTPVVVEGAIQSDARLLITLTGVYLGGSSSDDISMTLKAPAQNAEIIIKQLGQTTIEAIR
jgi:hypothetical protein